MSRKADTLCDGCGEVFPYAETCTCVCGAVVCDGCYEERHFMCEDDEDDVLDEGIEPRTAGQ